MSDVLELGTQARAAYHHFRDVELADTRSFRAEDWYVAGYVTGSRAGEVVAALVEKAQAVKAAFEAPEPHPVHWRRDLFDAIHDLNAVVLRLVEEPR